MAGRAKENLPRGTVKYLLVYFEIRILKNPTCFFLINYICQFKGICFETNTFREENLDPKLIRSRGYFFPNPATWSWQGDKHQLMKTNPIWQWLITGFGQGLSGKWISPPGKWNDHISNLVPQVHMFISVLVNPQFAKDQAVPTIAKYSCCIYI